MMRERNKFINKPNSKSFESRWITDLIEKNNKKGKSELESSFTTPKSNNNPIRIKPKMIENYTEKPKYNIEKNIYSSKFNQTLNGTGLNPNKIIKESKEKDLLQDNLNLISSVFNFDIRKFINDLADLTKTTQIQ